MNDQSYKVVLPLTSEHAHEVLALYKQSWWADKRDLSSTIKVMEGSDLCCGVFDDSDMLVGYGRVLSDLIEKAMIYDIIVDQEHRGRAIGRLIVESILESEACVKVNHVELYCKDEMMPFYNKLDFYNITQEVKLLRLNKL